MFHPIQSKIIEISNKLNMLGSFLSRCDQCNFYMYARIIEFVALEPVILVKLKNVSAHYRLNQSIESINFKPFLV